MRIGRLIVREQRQDEQAGVYTTRKRIKIVLPPDVVQRASLWLASAGLNIVSKVKEKKP